MIRAEGRGEGRPVLRGRGEGETKVEVEGTGQGEDPREGERKKRRRGKVRAKGDRGEGPHCGYPGPPGLPRVRVG